MYLRTGHAFIVVAHAEIERQLRRHAHVILSEEGILRQVRFRRRACGACAGKVLRVGRRRVVRKGRVRGKGVRAAEDAWEEIEDAIKIEVEAELVVVAA